MFAGSVGMASSLASRMVQEPAPAPAAAVPGAPRAEGLAAPKPAVESPAPAKPYEEAQYPKGPGGGEPGRHLDGRAAAPAVRGLRPCRADLRAHRRGHRLPDRRSSATTGSRTSSPGSCRCRSRSPRRFGAALTFMLIILYPRFTNYMMSIFSPTFLPYVLLFFARGLLPLQLLLRLGEVSSPGPPGPRARPQRRRHRDHVHRQCLADVHDVAARRRARRGALIVLWAASPTSRGCRSTCIASSPTSRSAARSPPLTPRSSSSRRRPTKSAPTTTGWATSATSSPSAPSCRCPSPATGWPGDLRLQRRRSGITMMGGAFSWLFIIQAMLIGNLFLAANYYLWLGMGRIEGAQPYPEVHQVPADRDRALLHGLGDAALDHRDRHRDQGDGRHRRTRCSASSA